MSQETYAWLAKNVLAGFVFAARLRPDDGETADQRTIKLLSAQLDTPVGQLLAV